MTWACCDAPAPADIATDADIAAAAAAAATTAAAAAAAAAAAVESSNEFFHPAELTGLKHFLIITSLHF